jgi:cytochrome P450
LASRIAAARAASGQTEGEVPIDLLRVSRSALLQVTAVLIGLDADNAEAVDNLTEYAARFAPGAALAYKDGDVEETWNEAIAARNQFSADVFEPLLENRRALVNAHRRGELPTHDLPRDLLTALLVHLPDLPDEMLLQEILLFIVASTDTTTHGVVTSLSHLFEWFDEHPEDLSKRTDREFLQGVVFEAIRLHPPPAVLREAAEDLALANGRKFSAGERVLVDLGAANRDTAVFGDDAEAFNPRREVAGRVQRYGLGFGGGAHSCIGRVMAAPPPTSSDVTSTDPAIGTVVRAVRFLLAAGIRLNPDDPPQLREGWLQERFERFPALIPAR